MDEARWWLLVAWINREDSFWQNRKALWINAWSSPWGTATCTLESSSRPKMMAWSRIVFLMATSPTGVGFDYVSGQPPAADVGLTDGGLRCHVQFTSSKLLRRKAYRVEASVPMCATVERVWGCEEGNSVREEEMLQASHVVIGTADAPLSASEISGR